MKQISDSNRSVIFATHMGQQFICADKIFKITGINNLWDITTDTNNRNDVFRVDTCSILLRPLSSISDKDAIEVAEMFGLFHTSDESKIYQVKEIIEANRQTNIHGNEWLKVYDYLRASGYATPQTVIENGLPVTLSVNELFEIGVYKLEE